MSPTRILIVDDSAFMRFTMSRYLENAPGITVIGAARDGLEALELIPELEPDVITLDINMPRLDGLGALRKIMARYPRPVIMLSNLTREGAHETLSALMWGAVDFVSKPTSRANILAIIDELVPKIRAAAGARILPLDPNLDPTSRPGIRTPGITPSNPVSQESPEKIVVIGASTGGPRALSTIIPRLPGDLPAALLIVQHMPPGFTCSLAERLDGISELKIKEAEMGEPLEKGKGFLAPGGFHMGVDGQRRITLNQKPPLHGVRPAVDMTMSSAVHSYGAATLGVVLTGMGRDGTHGAQQIHHTGGKVIAQDEASCVVWGMPRSVAEAGLADALAPLEEIPAAIQRMLGA